MFEKPASLFGRTIKTLTSAFLKALSVVIICEEAFSISEVTGC
jgi:hypothetical protein